jgi:hypothetical protein
MTSKEFEKVPTWRYATHGYVRRQRKSFLPPVDSLDLASWISMDTQWIVSGENKVAQAGTLRRED